MRPRRARNDGQRGLVRVGRRLGGDRPGRWTRPHRAGRAARPGSPCGSGRHGQAGPAGEVADPGVGRIELVVRLVDLGLEDHLGHRLVRDRPELLGQLPGLGQVGIVAGPVVADQGLGEQDEVAGPPGDRLGVACGVGPQDQLAELLAGPLPFAGGVQELGQPAAVLDGGGLACDQRLEVADGQPTALGSRPAPRGSRRGCAGRPRRRRCRPECRRRGPGPRRSSAAWRSRRPGRGCAGPRRPGRAICRRRPRARISLSVPSASATWLAWSRNSAKRRLTVRSLGSFTSAWALSNHPRAWSNHDLARSGSAAL